MPLDVVRPLQLALGRMRAVANFSNWLLWNVLTIRGTTVPSPSDKAVPLVTGESHLAR